MGGKFYYWLFCLLLRYIEGLENNYWVICSENWPCSAALDVSAAFLPCLQPKLSVVLLLLRMLSPRWWIFTIPGVAFVKLFSELGPVLLEEPWKLRRPHLWSHQDFGLTAGNSPFHEQFKSCGKLPLTLQGLSICGKLFRGRRIPF